MKKLKLFVFTLIVIFVFGILNVNAETFGYFDYSVNGDKVTITGYSESGPKAVVIPDTIDGKPVTAIGFGAFAMMDLTSVTIPEGVTLIGVEAFFGNQLTSVTIPSTVTIIDSAAFINSQLTSVAIPEGVTTIGESAFEDNQLTSVTIPSSVTQIKDRAFSIQQNSGTPTLKKVVILGKTTIIGNIDYNVFFYSTTDDFKMYGYAGSTGETYANATGVNYGKVAYDFVTLKELKTDMIAEIPTQYYTGTALKPVVSVKDGETTLTEGTDYTATYSSNGVIGTGKVTITGIGDYEYATATKTFKIEK